MLQPAFNLFHERPVTFLNLLQCLHNSARTASGKVVRECCELGLPVFFQVEEEIPFLCLAGLLHLTRDIQNLLVLEIQKVGHAQETELPGLISAHAE